MTKYIDAALKGGLAVSLVAVVVLSVLLSRQKDAIVQLEVQVNELETLESEVEEAEPCTCETDVRLLTACKGSLKMAREQITRASKARQLQAAGQGAAASSLPAEQEMQDMQVDGTAAVAQVEVPQQRVKDLFSGKLGLAPEQMQPLGELVCAAMALRQSLLDDYGYGQTSETETWQQLTQARKDLTAQMSEVLGPQKYKEFRAAGGIGALAMVVDCEG